MVTPEQYLRTSYPDGDREYIDGLVVERNAGSPTHSRLQKILVLHLAAFEESHRIEVLPECRTRITETRYRVPDIVAMLEPFRQTNRALLDAPCLVVEVLSPDDRLQDTIRRFKDYARFGVRHIVQMDPEDRTTWEFSGGKLIEGDLHGFEIAGRGYLPFDSRELLARLDRA